MKQFNWDILLTLIKGKMVIPVIGSDLLNVNDNGTVMPLYDYFVKQLAKTLDLSDYDMPFWVFVQNYQENTYLNDILFTVFNEIPEDKIDFGPLNKLALITDFNFYISLSFDCFLERAIKNINRQKTVNRINYSKVARQLNNQLNENADIHIYKMFGTINPANNYAKTRQEFFDYAFDHLRDSQYADYLLKNIEDKKFLFIGCKLPSMVKPHFTYSLVANGIGGINNNTLFLAQNDQDFEYLHYLGVKAEIYQTPKQHANNAVEFVNELHRRWLQEQDRNNIQYEGDVYISYHENDKDIACELKNKLKSLGVSCICNTAEINLLQQNGLIEDQVSKCNVFIPIVSGSSVQSDDDNERHLIELNVAKYRHYLFNDESDTDSFIMPLFIEDSIDKSKMPEILTKINSYTNNNEFFINSILMKLEPINDD